MARHVQNARAVSLRAGLLNGLLPLILMLPGCAAEKKANPAFPLTVGQAKKELRSMREHPVALARPVVVLGGWGDVMGLPPAELAKLLRQATGDERIIAIGFGGCVTFDGCRERVLKRVQEAFPSEDELATAEVDVIGFSMGGIVARYAALGEPIEGRTPAERRLNIARLYTISSPHRGSSMARVLPAGPLAWDMRPGSTFMRALDAQLDQADYPVIPYARLNDKTVGTANTAPPGQTPYWVPPEPLTRAHSDAYRDPRLVADIARHLRGETPYTTEPAAELPE